MSLQVYEHVYETVDINSSPEVRANATAKVGPLNCVLNAVITVCLQMFNTTLCICRPLWQLSQRARDTHIHVWWSCPRQKKAWVST